MTTTRPPGRFVSVDPVADFSDAQQINGYAYSDNNPVTFADPDGKFFGALIALIVTVVRAVMAVLNHVRRRSSQSASSGGTSTMGSANYAPAKARLLPPGATQLRHLRQQGAGGRPRAGQLQGHPRRHRRRRHRGLDADENTTEPWCWGGNSRCGVNDGYKEFTEKHGVDENTKNYDAGKDFTDAASMFNLAGLARHFLKNLFKKAPKKNVPKPKVPEVKMIDGWLPETAVDTVPEGFGPMKPTWKGVGHPFPGTKQESVRIDKGNLNNSQEFRQVDHVVINSGGKVIGRDGKPIKGAIDANEHNSYMARIPLDERLKWKKWNGPT